MNASIKDYPILVTGGTGYVGARLIPRLLEAGYKVRAVARSIDKLLSKPWASHPNIEIFPADVLDPETLAQTMRGCKIAYYLVHSMNTHNQKDFADIDKKAAQNMIDIADKVGLERIIYLGGLGFKESKLSSHLRSRNQVAEILTSGKSVKTTVFRAAMIIGSGSASFEILRYLVDRLPIMITPKWVFTPSQPIAIRNVLNYLVECVEKKETIGLTFDIGGNEVMTYYQLMRIYAEEAHLKERLIFPIPFFTPKLSSYWIHLVTPIPAALAQPLAEGLRNPAICENDHIKQIIPQELLTCREAFHLALERVKMQEVESHWTDAGSSLPPEWTYSGDPKWAGGTIYEDKRKIVLEAAPNDLWERVVRIGGETGWYYGDWLWSLRGVMDKVLGGVGLRRGRRHPSELRPGDALDFWRVVQVEENKRLILKAEMKLPGEAILEFRIIELDENKVELQQIARFLPRGLGGIAYWLAVTPLHFFVFNGMLSGIAKTSEKKILQGPELID